MILLSFNLSLVDKERENSEKFSASELISSIEKKTDIISQLLELHGYQATFFIEISLAIPLQKLLKSLSLSGHEIALYNVNSDAESVAKCKQDLEPILGKPIRGLRQKMQRFPSSQIKDLDFTYVSNIEHSKINFLWRKLTEKTEIYTENELTIVPESQSPYSQLPFNDYVLQVSPMKYYESMLLESLKSSEYVMIYANVWQFFPREELPFILPFYKKINVGRTFEDRIENLFQFLDDHEIAVSRMKDFLF
ncbi:MAG: polysaccharide deacetylase [Weeksellaceae bacterium]|nr:polysaccharide deacetylase [Weeksellaceae bacterium]